MLTVAFGGGVNSTAMVLGLLERQILPDVVLFADTQGEKPGTYEHLDRLNAYLATTGIAITVVRKASMYASLEEECLRRKSLPSLAYGWRSCSDKWKQEPQRKWMNHNAQAREVWAAGAKVRRAIGFGVEEQHRARPSPEVKYENWFPLIEWGWDREECVRAILRHGLPVPVKSACFFCPASTKPDVQRLKLEYPNLYGRALAMERNADLVTIKGLGRRWSWRSLEGPEPHYIEQTCLCFDGE